jgi:preprotein translocase subunit YajC
MTPALGTLVAHLYAATNKTQSNSFSPLLIFAVIGAAFYFLIYRPQQRKQKAARAEANAFEVGDEVVTAGGIVGRVIDITDDRVTLETSVGASFEVLRPYVLRKLVPVEPPTDVVDGEEGHDHDGGHEAGPDTDQAPDGGPSDEPPGGPDTPEPDAPR